VAALILQARLAHARPGMATVRRSIGWAATPNSTARRPRRLPPWSRAREGPGRDGMCALQGAGPRRPGRRGWM